VKRAETLAAHARILGAYTDRIVAAVRSRDTDAITHVRDQVRRLLPPHGFDLEDTLLVVLAAQIDTTVPVAQRLAWLDQPDQPEEGRCAA
jgi:hypothetical protein